MNPLSRYPAAFYMLLAVASCATTSQGSDELEIADEALWGGAEVKSSQLSAGLLIRHSCSAARVGSRHILTAAHCVWDKSTGKAKAGHEPGDVLSISSALDPSERGWSSVTVASVHLDPAFVPALADHVAGVRMLHAAGLRTSPSS